MYVRLKISSNTPLFLQLRICSGRPNGKKTLQTIKSLLSVCLIRMAILCKICVRKKGPLSILTGLATIPRCISFNKYGAIEFGIIGYAVGSSFSVLVAEELFASGCQLLISMSSAGQIVKKRKPPYFILIEKALRDEGTSYHYLPASDYSTINPELRDILSDAFIQFSLPLDQGVCWTTDAPFRETASSIEYFRSLGILAVEMEAAALYAFGEASDKPVICFAHVTNQMGSIEGDFEKGPVNGGNDAVQLIYVAAKAWMDWKPK